MCTSSFLFGATRVAAEEENPNYKENQKLVDDAITHEEAVVVSPQASAASSSSSSSMMQQQQQQQGECEEDNNNNKASTLFSRPIAGLRKKRQQSWFGLPVRKRKQQQHTTTSFFHSHKQHNNRSKRILNSIAAAQGRISQCSSSSNKKRWDLPIVLGLLMEDGALEQQAEQQRQLPLLADSLCCNGDGRTWSWCPCLVMGYDISSSMGLGFRVSGFCGTRSRHQGTRPYTNGGWSRRSYGGGKSSRSFRRR
ncbi:unnamed protein product [Sphagnum troendelagicum]|uniref:Uncharacterized protein n=1 Tax=Sphagnum troendelagicum TaxID=128251 RepID=A0ABP0UMT9_9BRYO